ncbi:MAG: deoxyhypusine synthase family protein [Candidatus Omnitrophica bacterium]|nr:deoxyhypusine synthase family protein [Candidatus Omnitrophota bacterium]
MINLKKVKTYSLRKRFSKVRMKDFSLPPKKNISFLRFYHSLPNILKAIELHDITGAIINARKKNKAIIFMLGAHVIKCGLNPILIELIKRRVINCICLNGAGLIHDFEIAFMGKTSEDVAKNLKTGRFGMAKEPAEFINQAVQEGVPQGLGLGKSIARKIGTSFLKYKDLSLLYNAYRYNIAVCAFVAIGTDIIHQHPNFNAGLTAEGSLRDFHLLVENIIRINKGGVVINFGSAVILPEVFLKALNLARNLGNPIKDFITANFDMLYHYRPLQNVVLRPTNLGGKGYYIIGHHEIMLPLLAQAIIEKI